jgi:hypothetical protein
MRLIQMNEGVICLNEELKLHTPFHRDLTISFTSRIWVLSRNIP